ncbi:tetratricopeptide repeat protein, partial [Photobacterium sp. OFAV2-7]|uniref:tetratricopeptide repeat protein n=1 Tax=Photobacterium sp. OFAV2-7 TaxID=2917748 RepID=UPI001EF49327
MLVGSGIRHLVMFSMASLLIGCAVSYEAAQEKYQNGEVTEAREAWASLAQEGDTRAMYKLYTTGSVNHSSDVDALKQAADLGYSPALYDYGLVLISREQYTSGLAQIDKAATQSFEPAIAWQKSHPEEIKYWPKAESGNRYSMVTLGEYYKDRKDYDEAYKWFKKSADLEYPSGYFYMGVMYDFGYSVDKNPNTAANWYLMAADKGNTTAAGNLCFMYRDGNGVKQDKTKAREFCTQSSKGGNVNATIELGRMYLHGIGGDKDPKKAFTLLEPLGSKDRFAAYHLGGIYYSGIGQPVDYPKAFYWYEKANKHNTFTLPAKRIAIMFEDGLGRIKSQSQAFKYYLIAAQRGDSFSQEKVGYYYRRGIGTAKDLQRSAEWFEKAAQQGRKISAYYIGMAYLNGNGVKASASKAEQYLLQSAKAGDMDAQFQLGYEYSNGNHFTKDNDKFALWTQRSADQEHRIAQYNLSVAYENGWGKEKNYAWAAYWRAKSAKQDYDSAKETFPKLLKKLSMLKVSKNTRVRSAADNDSKKVASVKKGDTVYFLGGNSSWKEVLLA